MTWTGPDDPTHDSAVASDAGSSGAHLGPGDLAPDEERLLAALERDARNGPVPVDEAAVASFGAALRRGPGPRGRRQPDDGLTPRFTAPDFDQPPPVSRP